MTSPVLEERGEFWLPGAEDDKVAGTLAFDHDGGGRLSLIGVLDDPFRGLRSSQQEPIRIVGQCGKSYTLEDCFLTRGNIRSGGPPTQEWHVNRLFQGAIFGADEPLHFDSLAIAVEGLNEWIGRIGIGQEGDIFRDGQIMVRAEQLDDLVIDIDEARLTLHQSIGYDGSLINERTIKQATSVKFEFGELLPLREVVDFASDLRALISIGTGRPAAFTNVSLFHPAITHELPSGVIREPIRFLAQWRPPPNDPDKALYIKGFTFDEFGGLDGIANWMNGVRGHRRALGRTMATWSTKSMFAEDRFINYVSAAEGLHRARRLKGKFPLAARLKDLADQAGAPFEVFSGDTDRWCKLVMDERDDIVHNFGRRPVVEGGLYFWLAESVRWLVVLCLLRECQAPPAAFQRLERSGDLSFVCERLTAALDGEQRGSETPAIE